MTQKEKMSRTRAGVSVAKGLSQRELIRSDRKIDPINRIDWICWRVEKDDNRQIPRVSFELLWI